jgi:3-oxoacyl-[acyl-carrier protein] reductase
MLDGRVAIVTGGGRGLGRAIAIACAREGASVAVASRTRDELERTVSIIEDNGGHAIAVKADVSDAGDITNLMRSVEMKLGLPDILVNNAAIVEPIGPLKDVSVEEFDHAMAVNLRSAFLCTRAAVPGMIAKRHGRIINVTSGLAETVLARLGVYSVAKAGLNHLTRLFAEELGGHNIQVFGLDPGVMDTRMQEDIRKTDIHRLGGEAYRVYWGYKQSGKLKDPDKVAELALFLLSDKADYLSGEIGGELHFMSYGYDLAA